MTCDGSPQFTLQVWTSVPRLFGTTFYHTTTYHPQANGMVERFHRYLKTALRLHLKSPNWIKELPRVLLGIRTAPKEDLGCPSAEIVYGAPLTLPGDFILSSSFTWVIFSTHAFMTKIRSLVVIQLILSLENSNF